MQIVGNRKERMQEEMSFANHTDGDPFECERCGTCCRKGGPGLHNVDFPIVAEKIVSPENLYTIRKGELIRDNINGGLVCTDTEIVKVRSAKGSSTCVYFDDAGSACRIYENRPAQCRAMKCRDIADITDMHVKNRLSRADLFENVDWVMELIDAHEERCSYRDAHDLIERRKEGDVSAVRELSGMIAYDQAVRDIVREKKAMGEGMLDLAFGLPLARVLEHRFGIRPEKSRAAFESEPAADV